MNANTSTLVRKMNRALHSARGYFESVCSHADDSDMHRLVRYLEFSRDELKEACAISRELADMSSFLFLNGLDPVAEAQRLAAGNFVLPSDLERAGRLLGCEGYGALFLDLGNMANSLVVQTHSFIQSVSMRAEFGKKMAAAHHSRRLPESLLTGMATLSSLWNCSQGFFIAAKLLLDELRLRESGKSLIASTGAVVVAA